MGEVSTIDRRIKWPVFVICLYAGVQGALTTGMMNSSYSTMEKIFKFSSEFIAYIEGSFHIGLLITIMPVNVYANSRPHRRPHIMCLGTITIAVGAFLITLAEVFRPGGVSYDLVAQNASENSSTEAPEELDCLSSTERGEYWQKYFFIAGMFVIGMGAAPVQTTALAFVDQVAASKREVAIAIFYSTSVLAPAIGFIANGLILRIPTDFLFGSTTLSSEEFKAGLVTPLESQKTLGAWWFGICLAGVSSLLIAPLLWRLQRWTTVASGYEVSTVSTAETEPSSEQHSVQGGELPPSPTTEPHLDVFMNTSAPFWKQMGSLWREGVKPLMKEKTFICLLVHGSLIHILTSGVMAFLAKIFESQYLLDPQNAAMLAGLVAIPAAFLGGLMSGVVIRCLKLMSTGLIRLETGSQVLALILIIPFCLVRCSNQHVFSIEESNQLSTLSGVDLYPSQCTTASLDESVSCLNGNFTILSTCFLPLCSGPDNETILCPEVDMQSGPCVTDNCRLKRIIGFTLVFSLMFMASMIAVPKMQAFLRVSPDKLKDISLGIQWIFFRVFGMIPGPMIYSFAFRIACENLASEPSCSRGTSDWTAASCWTRLLGNTVLLITASLLLGGLGALAGAIFYNEKRVKRLVDETIDSLEVRGKTLTTNGSPPDETVLCDRPVIPNSCSDEAIIEPSPNATSRGLSTSFSSVEDSLPEDYSSTSSVVALIPTSSSTHT